MLVRNLFGQTLREAPADAQIPSHRLLVRGAFLRQVAAGVWAWLPLGLRVLRQVEDVVREEMDAHGATELLMPALSPADLWQRTGRWDDYGPALYRLTDRSERQFCLAPTHEEVITFLASTELPSYRDLPSIPYQIQWKFRDEPRPRGGLLRGREFSMKDAYSFDADEDGLARSYDTMAAAYERICARCGISAVRIEAQPGTIGGSGRNEEFVQPAAAGEDTFVTCDGCGYAANTEAAASRVRAAYDFGEPAPEPRKVHTPGKVTVDEVASFLGVEPGRLAKALLYRAGEEVVCALVPGDRELNEYKLGKLVDGKALAMLTDEQFVPIGQAKGFTGPVGLRGIRLVADRSLEGARGLVTGANEHDHHLTDVVPARDFPQAQWADLVVAEADDGCARCDGTLSMKRGIEVGHVFELGSQKYAARMDATFTDESGTRRPFVMGCYGFGVSRAVAAIVEAHHDERGIRWPRAVAPYDVAVLLVSGDAVASDAAAEVYGQLLRAGVDAVLDDRAVSAGIKFADADLIGYPLQVVVGKTFVSSGRLEAKVRATGERQEIAAELDAVLAALDSCP